MISIATKSPSKSSAAQDVVIAAWISTLHESAADHSGSRRFLGEAVLRWTLRRLMQSGVCDKAVIACWEDQLASLQEATAGLDVSLRSCGSRSRSPRLDAVAAARRWADGWRGGLLATSAFDAGYHPQAVAEVARETSAGAVVLIDPSAACVDPDLIKAVVRQSCEHPTLDFTFTPAAPGLGCMLLSRATVERLAAAQSHPGRLLHYHPDQVSREPLAQDACAPTPTPVARSLHNFLLDSDTKVRWAESLFSGPAAPPSSAALVSIASRETRPTMREVVLELTTRRASRPIFLPAGQPAVDRPDMSVDEARRAIDRIAEAAVRRVTLAGVGDPLLHPGLAEILQYAASCGIRAHVETDLLDIDQSSVARLAESEADIVSCHIPALTPGVYQTMMGADGYATVLANLQAFVSRRAAAGRGTPLVVPIFVKCRQNQHEMEAWYDQWLRAVGSAVVVGPATFGGLVPDQAAADMRPPQRVACRRLGNRLMVLSDGTAVACEQDVAARQPLGLVREKSLKEIWNGPAEGLRSCHRDGRWNTQPLCAGCHEWHRP